MCDVDKADMLKSLYEIDRKSPEWWHRIFFHLLDVALVNSYIIYKNLWNEDLQLKFDLSKASRWLWNDFEEHVSKNDINWNVNICFSSKEAQDKDAETEFDISIDVFFRDMFSVTQHKASYRRYGHRRRIVRFFPHFTRDRRKFIQSPANFDPQKTLIQPILCKYLGIACTKLQAHSQIIPAILRGVLVSCLCDECHNTIQK